MKKFFLILLPLIALVSPIVVLLAPNKTFAALPVSGATLGQSCSFNLDCQQPSLACINGTCSICGPYLPSCASGSSCTNGVCQLVGGNEAQGLCAVNSNCKSPLICGPNKVCQSVEYSTPTPSVTVNPNSSGLPGENDWTGMDVTIQDVEAIIIGIACWMMRVAGALMVIFLTWAGILYMYAQGDTAKLKTAKDAFQKTIWGVLIILGVYVIIATVANTVGLHNFSLIPLAC